jgi:hypothetical protein
MGRTFLRSVSAWFLVVVAACLDWRASFSPSFLVKAPNRVVGPFKFAAFGRGSGLLSSVRV